MARTALSLLHQWSLHKRLQHPVSHETQHPTDNLSSFTLMRLSCSVVCFCIPCIASASSGVCSVTELRFLHILRHSCSIATLAHRSLHNQQAIFHYILDPAARLIKLLHPISLWTACPRCTNHIFCPIPFITPSRRTAVRVLPLRRHRSNGSLTPKLHTRWLR